MIWFSLEQFCYSCVEYNDWGQRCRYKGEYVNEYDRACSYYMSEVCGACKFFCYNTVDDINGYCMFYQHEAKANDNVCFSHFERML